MACGFTSDFLYERLKAAEEQGSEAARQLMQDLLLAQEAEAEEAGADAEVKTPARKSRKQPSLYRTTSF